MSFHILSMSTIFGVKKKTGLCEPMLRIDCKFPKQPPLP